MVSNPDFDINKEVKLCTSCKKPGVKDGYMSWRCKNDDCGVLHFRSGFTEWYSDANFLTSIDWGEIFGISTDDGESIF